MVRYVPFTSPNAPCGHYPSSSFPSLACRASPCCSNHARFSTNMFWHAGSLRTPSVTCSRRDAECYDSFFCPTIRRYVGLPSSSSPPSSHRASVLLRSNLAETIPSCCLLSCTIFIWCHDTHLRATHTTTSSIRGVQIPIYLVSDATDSLQRSVAVLKLYQ